MASSRFDFSPGGVPFLSPVRGTASLNRLMEETGLQKMLADEKMRSDQHKTNYQILKAEHTKLQNENIHLQNEMENLLREHQDVQEKHRLFEERAQRELSVRNGELQEAQSKAITQQRLELLRMQIAEELEPKYKKKISEAEKEADSYRSEYNKLHLDYSFLKTEFEHLEQQYKTDIESLKMQYETEASNLRKEREVYMSRQHEDTSHDAQKVRVLQREKAQLNQKVKGLLGELEEIRLQREQLGVQSDHVSKLQGKQMVENAANIRALETERQSLKLQCENLQKELSTTSALNTQLTGKIHRLETENVQAKNELEEMNHNAKMEVSNLRMEMVKQRGDLERDRDHLANTIEDLKSQVEIAKHSASQQAKKLVEKERECVKRIQDAREEEWGKMNKIEGERLELETKIQEYERRKVDDETRAHTAKEKMEEEIKSAVSVKEIAEKECQLLRSQIQNLRDAKSDLEESQAMNSQLRDKVHGLEAEINTLLTSEHELNDMNIKLSQTIEFLKTQLRQVKEDLTKNEDANKMILAQHRAAAADEKIQLRTRIEDLETKLQDVHSKCSQDTTEFKKKKKQYIKLIQKQKDKVQQLETKCQNYEIESEELKKSKAVSLDEYNRLRKSLKDLGRRQKDFKTLLQASIPAEVPIGDKTFASFVVPSQAVSPVINFVEQDRLNQNDLNMLRQSVDALDRTQRQQIDALVGDRQTEGPLLTSTLRRNDDHANDISDS